MKKCLVFLLLLLFTIEFIGCGHSPQAGIDETVTSSSSSDPSDQGGIEVEKEIFDVKINFPKSMFEGQDLDAIREDALKQGVHEVIKNDDGSVTYVMNKSKHREMLTDLKKSIKESVSEFLESEENKAIFKEIEYNKDYSELNVKVDASQYSSFQGLSLIGMEFLGLMYQGFNGVEDASIKTNILDDSTGDMIESSIYPEK